MMISDCYQTVLDNLPHMSNFSNVVLSIAALFALRQLRLMKIDMLARADRSAKENAINLCRDMLKTYAELLGIFYNEYKSKGLKPYKGAIGNFTPASIPHDLKETLLGRIQLDSWLPAMNLLESIAAGFTTGVADEKTGYDIIGLYFCNTVENQYDIIATSRGENPYWQNIVTLYGVWTARHTEAALERKKQELSQEFQAQVDAIEKKLSQEPRLSIKPLRPQV